MRHILLAILVTTPFLLSGCFGAKELPKEELAVTFSREVDRGNYDIVTVKELKKWMDEKKDMVIIDTMPKEGSYDKNHIPGAVQILFPIPEMNAIEDSKKEEFIKLLGEDKEKAIVVYCGFTKCTRSHNGAMWAVKMGYTNVYRCPGGIVGWKEAGFPVAKK